MAKVKPSVKKTWVKPPLSTRAQAQFILAAKKVARKINELKLATLVSTK